MKILMTTMSLGIGGAETHIVELSKELKRRGHDVIIASNGGVYEEELHSAGIRHIRIPLHNKNPKNMLRSKKLLKETILEEKPDVVHSHARIPSFILSKLHKKLNFTFVTTAHGVFSTKYGLKYITRWGEKTISVSEDINEYLMKNYGIPEEDITLTINGIDTGKFSPDTDCGDVMREFSLSENDNIITYVCRLEKDNSLVAHLLIESFPYLNEKIENLKMILVGDGNDYDSLKSLADGCNEKYGRQAIIMPGARTDISALISPCKVFVGVSRATLEAMAEAKPVIIAGNQGYIGLFDESKTDISLKTNFCARGCGLPDRETLSSEILRAFAAGEEKLRSLGQYGREIVLEKYSLIRMADDAEKVYRSAKKNHKRVLISGYYGFHNSGDDALLMAIINQLKNADSETDITVLSKCPEETEKLYGVRAVQRMNYFDVKRAIGKCDLLLSGGGTLIQDATSERSLVYYLFVIAMALKKHRKVMIYAGGIGPICKKKNVKRVGKILNKVDVIALRDKASLAELEKAGVTKPYTEVTADAAFDSPAPSPEDFREEKYGIEKETKLLGIALREWSVMADGFEDSLAHICDYAYEKYGLSPLFIPMQPENDTNIAKRIMGKITSAPSFLIDDSDMKVSQSALGHVSVCIGMRLHSLIFSAMAGVPLIGIVYDPKVYGFLEALEIHDYEDVKNLSEERVRKMLDSVMTDLPGKQSEMKEKASSLILGAKRNTSLATELLCGKGTM